MSADSEHEKQIWPPPPSFPHHPNKPSVSEPMALPKATGRFARIRGLTSLCFAILGWLLLTIDLWHHRLPDHRVWLLASGGIAFAPRSKSQSSTLLALLLLTAYMFSIILRPGNPPLDW